MISCKPSPLAAVASRAGTAFQPQRLEPADPAICHAGSADLEDGTERARRNGKDGRGVALAPYYAAVGQDDGIGEPETHLAVR